MHRLLRRQFLTGSAAISIAAFGLSAVPVWAETRIVSAPDANAAIQSGDMILLDIRTVAEWKETGLAKGAWPVSMHTSDFGPKLNAVLKKHSDKQIGLICATGGRTSYVTDILEKNGITGVIDVSEGMMGNKSGAGWIARGLPIVDVAAAQQDYDTAMQ